MNDQIELRGLQPRQDIELSPLKQELQSTQAKDSFANMLTRAINGVDETMKESDQKIQSFIAGETENVHDVMISMQRAQVSFQLMTEVRNKAIEAYHEISRMQI